MKVVQEQIVVFKDSKSNTNTPQNLPQRVKVPSWLWAQRKRPTYKSSVYRAIFIKEYDLKRVYYSGYVPMLSDNRLPAMGTLCRWCEKIACTKRIG